MSMHLFASKLLLIIGIFFHQTLLLAGDIAEVMKSGKLRHLGIPYANFVSKNYDAGLDVELMNWTLAI